MKKRKIILLIVLFLAVIGSLVTFFAARDYRAKNTYVSFFDYHKELDADETVVFYGGKYTPGQKPPLRIDGTLYFHADFIKSLIDGYIFWDSASGRLTVTTSERVLKFSADSCDYTLNDRENLALSEPVLKIGGNAYVPECFLAEIYDIAASYKSSLNGALKIAVLEARSGGEIKYAETLADNVKLRYEAGAKAPICEKLMKGAKLVILEENQKTGWAYARTENGLAGFVRLKDIGTAEIVKLPDKPVVPEYAPKVTQDGKIVMAWQVFGKLEESLYPGVGSIPAAQKGLDVLSPTWFSFDADKLDGSIVSIAGADFSDWAHSWGLQVWGLLSDNFSYNVSNAVLSVTERREYITRQLIAFVDEYKMDGVNIDFEMVRESDIGYFIQFLRELYPLMKEKGKILSVDMKPPQNWNLYYNRAEVAKTCDFIVIMAYDEHWSTSPESGPNASIGFVKDAITDTLKEAPPEKVILGMPFYVRVWRETPEGKVSSRSYSMDRAFAIFAERGCAFIWDTESGCYYAEYYEEENGERIKYSVWLEDEITIEEKLKLAAEYGLAGIAGWRRGLEKNVVWDLVYDYMKSGVGDR